MERILIIGAGTFQMPIIQRASKEYEVLLAAPVIDERFEPYINKKLIVDVRDKETILEFAKENRIKGVITDQTDISVRSVAYVAEKLGLPGIGYETGCLFTDKSRMREKQVELGIKVLPNATVSTIEEAIYFFNELNSKVIIKPLDTQGSRGVALCESKEDIMNKFEEASRWSSNKKVVIEKYATGREFVVEGIAFNYQFENLIIGDTLYFDIPDAYSAKTRIFPTTADDGLKKRVFDLNKRIIKGFGLKQGMTHSEFIMDGDEIYLIETAARGGGVFISSDLIHLGTGLDTEKTLLDMCTGKTKEFPRFQQDVQACGYMAFYVPDGNIISIIGKDEIQSLDFVHRNQLDELYVGKKISGGQNDKTTRFAIIVSGKTREELEKRMNYIRETLKIESEGEQGIRGIIWE